MAQLYFHCSTSQHVLIDETGTAVGDLAEARDHAARVVQSFVTTLSAEDWREWVLHVRDDLDDEIFAVSFASVLGKPH
jgi:hypothetical protein